MNGIDVEAVLKEISSEQPKMSDAAKARLMAALEDELRAISGRRKPQPDTIKAVRDLRDEGMTWREMAQYLGYAPGYAPVLRDIAFEEDAAISPMAELLLRKRLGLPPVLPRKEVSVCPSCLAKGVFAVHAVEDCNGKTGIVKIVNAPRRRREWKSISLRAKTIENLREMARSRNMTLDGYVTSLLMLDMIYKEGQRRG